MELLFGDLYGALHPLIQGVDETQRPRVPVPVPLRARGPAEEKVTVEEKQKRPPAKAPSVTAVPRRIDNHPKTGKCYIAGRNPGQWHSYTPNPRHVLIILHGFNGSGRRLRELGYKVTEIYVRHMDSYPKGWTQKAEVRRKRLSAALPNANADGSKPYPHDLISVADHVVFPRLQSLVRAGNGPCAILTGSRGGQVTISRLWKMWQGPSVVLNGGCTAIEAPPKHVNLGLMCGSGDFFRSRDPRFVHRHFDRWPGAVVHYHHPNDDHGVQTFAHAIGTVLRMTISGSTTPSGSGLDSALWRASPTRYAQVWLKQKAPGTGFQRLQ